MRLYLVISCILFSSRVRVRIRVRIRLSVWLVSDYTHLFVLLSVVILTAMCGVVVYTLAADETLQDRLANCSVEISEYTFTSYMASLYFTVASVSSVGYVFRYAPRTFPCTLE